MNKEEIYYKFIFPKREHLQTSSVKALLNATHYSNGYVQTYEELSDTVRGYVDQFLGLPKYFDLRIYWDDVTGNEICGEQREGGGFSLLVSHSPEVQSDSIHSNTKFTAQDGKTVYCSVIISSGDFFYNWNLPEEVLVKSGLRNDIVKRRFHKNWYFTKTEKNNYKDPNDPSKFIARVEIGQEKRVFETRFFKYDNFPYVHQGTPKYVVLYRDSATNNTYLHDFVYYSDSWVRDEDLIITSPSQSQIEYPRNIEGSYDGLWFPPETNGQFYLKRANNTHLLVERHRFDYDKDNQYNYTYYYGSSRIGVQPNERDSFGNITSYKEKNDTSVIHTPNEVTKVEVKPVKDNAGNILYYKDADNNHYTVDDYYIGTYYYVLYVKNTSNTNIVEVTPAQDSSGNIIYDNFGNPIYYKDADNNHFTKMDLLQVSIRFAPEEYRDLTEDLKKDFIDLEVTRRILYNYYDSTQFYNIPRISIPISTTGTGRDTVLNFNPPQEYLDKPPMPIKYWLLRDSLNYRDPYGDCETVLVMWVADSDPANIADGNITALRNLHWKQYAIPISARCCKKNGGYSTERFILSYPHVYTNTGSYTWRFHTRRNSAYSYDSTSPSFKEVLYLQNLIEYSRDCVLSYQNFYLVGTRTENNIVRDYTTVFDIQKYLLKNCRSSFKVLYSKKQNSSISYNREQQNYYIRVNNSPEVYSINTNLDICFTEYNQNVRFTPSLHIKKSDYQNSSHDYRDWGFNEYGTDWNINDAWFIALFSLNNLIEEKIGTLEIVNASTLKENLCHLLPYTAPVSQPHSHSDWEDIYLSSLGITPVRNWFNADALLYGLGDPGTVAHIGFLDGHIKIGNTVYGRTTGNGVVVGFKDVFDYANKDYHHFRYNSTTDKYELVESSNRTLQYIAYVMNYQE